MGERLQFERFVWFDAEVRRGRYPNATSFAEQFECSGKTAQRYIGHFRDRIRAPLDYDPVRKGYHYLDPHWELPVMHVTEGELIALLISRKILSDLSAGPLSHELSHIAEKLGALLLENLPAGISPDQAFSLRINGFSPSNQETFQTVSTALLQRRLLSFGYVSPLSPDSTERLVEAHHLVNYQGTWHLIAWCRLRSQWRDFVLSRMADCRIMEEQFTQRDGAGWRPYLTETFGIFQNRARFDVVVQFSPERACWVRGEVWHPQQAMEELPDGSLVLTLPVSHEAEILMEILRHGSHVRVLEPAWLREKVVDEIGRMKNNYDVGQ